MTYKLWVALVGVTMLLNAQEEFVKATKRTKKESNAKVQEDTLNSVAHSMHYLTGIGKNVARGQHHMAEAQQYVLDLSLDILNQEYKSTVQVRNTCKEIETELQKIAQEEEKLACRKARCNQSLRSLRK